MDVRASQSYFDEVKKAGSSGWIFAEMRCLERVLPLAHDASTAIEGMRDAVTPECLFRREYFRVEGALAALASICRQELLNLMQHACWEVSLRIRVRIIRQALAKAASLHVHENGPPAEGWQATVNAAEMLRTAKLLDEFAFERAIGPAFRKVFTPIVNDHETWIKYAKAVVTLKELGLRRGAGTIKNIQYRNYRYIPPTVKKSGLSPEVALATIRRLLDEIVSESVQHEHVGYLIRRCQQVLTALEDAARLSCHNNSCSAL